jgi:hypothetical protein
MHLATRQMAAETTRLAREKASARNSEGRATVSGDSDEVTPAPPARPTRPASPRITPPALARPLAEPRPLRTPRRRSSAQAKRHRALLASLGPARMLAALRAAGGIAAVAAKAQLEHIRFEIGAAGMGKEHPVHTDAQVHGSVML